MLNNNEYFDKDKTWKQRLDSWLAGKSQSFQPANRLAITKSLADPETGLRMVVNIPADALLSFLRAGKYLNIYENPVVGGKPRTPSPKRQEVDGWLGLEGHPREYYFGAVAAGGTGIRFYGEYCMVLRRDAVPPDTRIFDRNSYDLAYPPFDSMQKEERCRPRRRAS
jgi:hypothetical protein